MPRTVLFAMHVGRLACLALPVLVLAGPRKAVPAFCVSRLCAVTVLRRLSDAPENKMADFRSLKIGKHPPKVKPRRDP